MPCIDDQMYLIQTTMKKNFLRQLRHQRPVIYLGGLSIIFVFFLIPLLSSLLLNANKAEAAWFSSSWLYRKSLTIDSDQVSGTGDLTNFPILVSRTDSDLQANAQADSDDIVFTSSDGVTQLDHEIEKYTSGTGTLVAWVEIPTLDGDADTIIYMYYGNSGATAQENPTGVWDSNYVGVWHMSEDPSGIAPQILDSTNNNLDLTSAGSMTTGDLIASKVGDGIDLDGTNDYLTINDSATVSFGGNSFTLESWINVPGSHVSDTSIIGKAHSSGSHTNPYFEYALQLGSTGQPRSFLATGTLSGNFTSVTSVSGAISVNTWHHLVAAKDSSLVRIYVNGSQNNTNSASGNIQDFSGPLRIGSNGGPGEYTKGTVDEVRISNISRSTDWLTTTYNTMNNNAAFFSSVGSAETQTTTSNAVVALKFDDASGTIAEDSSGQNQDGTISGATWKTPDLCQIEFCLLFDGSDDIVTVTNTSTIDFNEGLAENFTIMSWVKVLSDGEGSVGEIWQKGTNSYMRTTNEGTDGKVDLEASLDLTTSDATATVTDGLTLNTWHHVALIYTDDGDDEITIYIDGIARAVSANGTGAPAAGDTNNLLIGGSSSANFHGYIDFLKVYQTELSQASILTNALNSSALDGASASLGSNSQLFLSQNLVGYWKLDETSGNASDSSGNANTLTDVNTVAFTTTGGKFYNAGDFESGNSEYQYIADSAALSITRSLTVSAWIRPESITASTHFDIMGKWDGSNESYLLSQYGDEFRFYLDSSSNYVESSNADLATSLWYHVLATYNADTATATIYLNGKELSTTTTGTIPSSIGDDAGRFHIGAEDSSTSATNFYDGILDDLRFYSRAFNTTDVQKMFDWAPGPVLYYDFNENTGTSTVSDRSGNGITGTMTGSMANDDWVPGKIGSALEFDGTNDNVQVADTALLDIVGPMTISMWVKPFTMNSPQNEGLLTKSSNETGFSNQRSYTLQITEPGTDKFNFTISSDGTSATNSTLDSATIPVENTWYHVTATYLPGVYQRIYVNGVLDAEKTASVPSTIFNSTAPFRLANQFLLNSGGDYYFDGVIDEVRMYNYVRSSGQIVEDMNSGHPSGGSPEGTQVLHYQMDEMYGTTINNQITANSSLTGTISGATWTAQASCKINNCLDFDGADDSIAVTNANAIDFDTNLASSFTFSAWIYPDGAGEGSGGRIYSKGTNSWLRVDTLSSGFLDIQANQDLTTSDATVNATAKITQSAWNHVALTYEDDEDDEITIWVNGIAVGTSADGSGTPIITDSAALTIGNETGGTTQTFDGKIDDFKIYSSALTTEQIRIDMNANSAINLSTGAIEASQLSDGAGNAPVLYWSFNENTGSTVQDQTGNENAGTITGATFSAGKVGSAMRFSTTNTDRVEKITPNNIPANNSAQSLSYWYKVDANPVGPDVAVNILGAGSSAVQCGFRGSTIMCWKNGGTELVNTSTLPAAGTWNHVVYTFDGTNHTLYLNGVYQETSTVAANTGAASDVQVGYNGDSTTEDWENGEIDEVKIWNYELTQSQVMYEFNRGGPIGWWKFDDNTGTTAQDTGVQNLDGTLTNMDAGTDWVSGKFNYALDFDGTDDFVSVTNANPIDLNVGLLQGFTFATWVYPHSDGETDVGQIFQKGTNTYCNTNGESGGRVDITCQVDLTTDASFEVTSAIPINQWSHIAFSWTNDGDDEVTIWINGSPNTSSASYSGDPAADANNLLIGGSTNYDGLIDDFRVYNYELSGSQIKQIMNYSALRFGPPTGTP